MCPKWLIYIIFAMCSADVINCDNFCQSENCLDEIDSKSLKCPRQEVIKLRDIEEIELELGKLREKMFFIESSGRNHLMPRQACAVESSAIHNSPHMLSVVSITSEVLDLSANNATCQLYDKYVGKGVEFVKVDPEKFFKNTPMEGVVGRIMQSQHHIVHLSDALRLMLVYKYGGWYSDLDMIHIRPIPEFSSSSSSSSSNNNNNNNNNNNKEVFVTRNCISGDHLQIIDLFERDEHYDGSVGENLNNAIFRFDKKHPFLEACIESFVAAYNPNNRLSVGPQLLTNVLKNKVCDIKITSKKKVITPKVFTPEKCKGVSILPQNVFYPVGWFEYAILYGRLWPPSKWDWLFSSSLGVHFFSSGDTAKRSKMQNIKFYGAAVPALLHLGRQHCPLAFESEKVF